MKRALLACLFALGLITPALAHKPSDSLLTLTAKGDLIDGQWDIALRDLDHAIGLDSNDDAAITWGELREHHQSIVAYALPRLQLVGRAGPCRIDVTDHLVDRHSDGAYAVLRFVADCSLPADTVIVRYSLFRGIDPQHRGILRVGGTEQVFLFADTQNEQQIDLSRASAAWHAGSAAALSSGQLILIIALVAAFLPAGISLVELSKIAVAFFLGQILSGTLALVGAITLSTPLLAAGRSAAIVATATLPMVIHRRHRWVPVFAFAVLNGFVLAEALSDAAHPDLTMHDIWVLNTGFAVAGALPLVTAVAIAVVLAHLNYTWMIDSEGSRRPRAGSPRLRGAASQGDARGPQGPRLHSERIAWQLPHSVIPAQAGIHPQPRTVATDGFPPSRE